MPAIVDNLTLVDPRAELVEVGGTITGTNVRTRISPPVYAFENLGAGVIGDGAWHRAFFKLTSVGTNMVMVPVMTGNTATDFWGFFTTPIDATCILLLKSTSITWEIWHLNSIPFNIERASKVFPFLLNNMYAIDQIRSVQTITGNLYDIDGGHGAPFTQVDTQTLIGVQLILDHSDRMAFAGSGDNAGGSGSTFQTTLWNMNADGVIVPPAIFQAASL